MLTKLLLFSTALLAAACQATNPAATSVPPPPADPTPPPAEPAGGGSERLFAHRWALTELAGQPVAPTSDAQQAHLLFFPPNRLGGSTGCNRLTGTFELLGGGQLKFSPLATTRMGCPEPAAAAESRFLQVLGTGQTYYVTDTTLVLRAGPTIVVRFRAVPASPEK